MINQSSTNTDYYTVEKILEQKEQDGQTFYLVKWQGWDIKSCTWENSKHLTHLKNLIRQFKQSRRFDQKRNEASVMLEVVQPGMSPYQETKVHGHVLYGDQPENVLEVTVAEKNGIKVVHFLVQWKDREDGFRPFKSLIDSRLLTEHYPQFVCRFYQSKISLIQCP